MNVTALLPGLPLGLVALWAVLVVLLIVVRPKGSSVREAARLLPDLLRLLKRLATDRDLPWGVRVRLGLLLAYLALPFDIIPDFVPVIGYADDAIIAAWVLRGTVRHVGMEPLERLWAGTTEGLGVLTSLAGLTARKPE